VECAAIFAIFTSQAWNMAFSLYQSLRTVPAELQEAARCSSSRAGSASGARAAVRDARAAVEHDDVDVGRLVLRRRLRGDLGLEPEHQAAGVGSYIALAIEARATSVRSLGDRRDRWSAFVLYDQRLFSPAAGVGPTIPLRGSGTETRRVVAADWLRRTRRAARWRSVVRSLDAAWSFRRRSTALDPRAPRGSTGSLQRAWDAALLAAACCSRCGGC
jgi:NitT/TauT family transport system permease protein